MRKYLVLLIISDNNLCKVSLGFELDYMINFIYFFLCFNIKYVELGKGFWWRLKEGWKIMVIISIWFIIELDDFGYVMVVLM